MKINGLSFDTAFIFYNDGVDGGGRNPKKILLVWQNHSNHKFSLRSAFFAGGGVVRQTGAGYC